MFTDMFGNFTEGKIGRVRFVIMTALLAIALYALAVAMGGAAAIYDYLTGTIGGSPEVSMAGFLIFLAAAAAWFVSTLNLVAKRARDAGWNPLVVVLLYIVFSGLVWIVLALYPGRPGIQA